MTNQASNFETNASGTTLTTGNCNFDQISIAGTLATNATPGRHTNAKQAVKIATTSATPTYAIWSSTAYTPVGSTISMRGYFYFTANPPGSVELFFLLTSGFGSQAAVRVTSGGKLSVGATGGAGIVNGTVNIPLNQWFRVEAQIVMNATTGSITARLYSQPDTNTIADTVTTSGVNTGTTYAKGGIGNVGGVTATTGYYASEVIFSDTGWIGPQYQSLWSSTFETLANTTALTNGNSGFSVVNTSAGNTMVIDTGITLSHTGSNPCKVTDNGLGQPYAVLVPTASATVFGRGYFYFTGTPASDLTLLVGRNSGGATVFYLLIQSTGKWALVNNGTAVATGTTTVALNQWVRFEFSYYDDTGTAGYFIGKYYASKDSTTATETLTATAITSSQTFNQVGFGVTLSNTGSYYASELAFNDYDWQGPSVTGISDSETGTFVDAVSTLATSRTATETGTGVDAVTSLVQPIAASETGTFVDAKLTLNAALSATETGSGVEAGSILVPRSDTETGTFTEGAAVSTLLSITDGDTGRFRDACSLVPTGTFFTPPYVVERFTFHNRVTRTQNTGISVIKTAGSYVTVQNPTADQLAACDIAYLGGRDYLIDPTEQAALVAAGYGSYIAARVYVPS